MSRARSLVGCASGRHSGGRGFDPSVRHHSFVEFDHGMVSTVIISFPQIQKGSCQAGEITKFIIDNRVKDPVRLLLTTDLRTS